MKKIGILFGQEHSFPPAFVERVNQKTSGKDIFAEFVKIDKVIQGEPCGYDVVIDRISQDVPFYRAWLKNAALTGTAVGKEFSITSAGRRSSSRSPAAVGKMYIGFTIRKNFTGLTTRPATS